MGKLSQVTYYVTNNSLCQEVTYLLYCLYVSNCSLDQPQMPGLIIFHLSTLTALFVLLHLLLSDQRPHDAVSNTKTVNDHMQINNNHGVHVQGRGLLGC